MFETSLFWAFLIVTAAAFYITSEAQVRIRATMLTVASVLALVFVVKVNPLWIVFLIGTSTWLIIGLKITRRMAANRGALASWLVFLPVLVPWVLGKQAVAVGWTPLSILYFVGFSFYVIKAWTLIKDYHGNRIERLDPFIVLAYFLFFPAYIAGPMHYFGEFDKSIREPSRLDVETLVDIVFRVLLGFVKIKLVTALFIPLSLEAVKASGRIGLRGLVVGSFAYSIVIWADFSGYSDLAISTSRVMGIQTPENFNYPYAAVNIRDFWQRWHMTFSRVLTTYMFIPIARSLQRALGSRRKSPLIASCLITFLFCGYWHGPTLNFILWGLYHGAGLVIYDLYRQVANKRRLKRNGKPLFPYAESLARVASGVLTFSFVSLGWIFFVLPAGMIFRGLSR
jgi:D-alanyl-lipoteichoic acid acyltransferase DltB (MBOAT superfamily)